MGLPMGRLGRIMRCKKCGGERTREKCNLCELFASGLVYSGVEVERQSKPKYSDAMAVHPDQVPEAIADAKKKGVPTDFLADGRPIFVSRAHQKRYIRAYGFYNKDGGYGD